MGPARELKKALEKYWSSEGDERALLNEAARVRALHWKDQAAAGIDLIPSGDFSLYDHVLDTAAMLGAFPERYGSTGEAVSLSSYFAMARGSQSAGRDLPALEMTKWFDTNYHYIVPEVDARQRFRLSFTKAVDHFEEALALGVKTRPVLLGPGHLPVPCQAGRRENRSAVTAGRRAPGLRADAGAPVRPRRSLGADGRADPRHRPGRAGPQGFPSRICASQECRRAQDHARHIFRRPA